VYVRAPYAFKKTKFTYQKKKKKNWLGLLHL